MIHVIATIHIASGRRNEFLEAFHQLTPKVRAEDGCIEYGPTLDVETDIAAQALKGPDVVTVIEKWDSLDALRAHLVAPHMADYRAQVADLVQNVTLHILTPA